MTNDGAVITDARVAAAHDGTAELIVEIQYENGGTTEVTLDEAAAAVLMQLCEATGLEELKGHGWSEVKDALATAWNRFQDK